MNHLHNVNKLRARMKLCPGGEITVTKPGLLELVGCLLRDQLTTAKAKLDQRRAFVTQPTPDIEDLVNLRDTCAAMIVSK